MAGVESFLECGCGFNVIKQGRVEQAMLHLSYKTAKPAQRMLAVTCYPRLSPGQNPGLQSEALGIASGRLPFAEGIYRLPASPKYSSFATRPRLSVRFSPSSLNRC